MMGLEVGNFPGDAPDFVIGARIVFLIGPVNNLKNDAVQFEEHKAGAPVLVGSIQRKSDTKPCAVMGDGAVRVWRIYNDMIKLNVRYVFAHILAIWFRENKGLYAVAMRVGAPELLPFIAASFNIRRGQAASHTQMVAGFYVIGRKRQRRQGCGFLAQDITDMIIRMRAIRGYNFKPYISRLKMGRLELISKIVSLRFYS